jgi:hypothetical protein
MSVVGRLVDLLTELLACIGRRQLATPVPHACRPTTATGGTQVRLGDAGGVARLPNRYERAVELDAGVDHQAALREAELVAAKRRQEAERAAAAEAEAKELSDREMLTRRLQAALKRVGCYAVRLLAAFAQRAAGGFYVQQIETGGADGEVQHAVFARLGFTDRDGARSPGIDDMSGIVVVPLRRDHVGTTVLFWGEKRPQGAPSSMASTTRACTAEKAHGPRGTQHPITEPKALTVQVSSKKASRLPSRYSGKRALATRRWNATAACHEPTKTPSSLGV